MLAIQELIGTEPDEGEFLQRERQLGGLLPADNLPRQVGNVSEQYKMRHG